MSSDSEEEVRVALVDGDAEENATQTPEEANEPSSSAATDNAEGEVSAPEPPPPQPVSPTPPVREDRMATSVPPLAWFLAGGAAFAGVYLIRRLISRNAGNSRRSQPKHLFLETLSLDRPSLPQSPVTPLLPGHKLAVCDRIDVAGVRTRFGSPSFQAAQKPCTLSAPIVDQLLAVGATLVGTLPSAPLGVTGTTAATPALPNPAAKGHVHGGGEYGAAVAAACAAADLCLAVDEGGSALIPAAACGAFAYRPTQGVLPLEGAALGSATLGTTCLLAGSPAALGRAAKALRVPGGGTAAAGVVSRYLVAEDLFALCGGEVKAAAPAVVAAVKRWAGPEHAQGLSLCDWLHHRIPSLAAFMPSKANADSGANGGDGGVNATDVLAALAAAAEAVRCREWLDSRAGKWALATEAQRDQALPTEAAEGLEAARGVSEPRYRSAIAVASELEGGMRAALQEGYVFVLPTTPGPAPKNGAAAAAWRRRAVEFAALASLAGVPQVAMPVPSSARAGSPPLSISLVTLQRRDLLLIKAAGKLSAMLTAEVAALGAGGGPEAKKVKKAAAKAAEKEAVASNAAAAEAAKEEGNAAFKAGRYDEAVRRYSEAITRDPQCAVYYSNRAMAHLKLGRYTAAEADADAALQLDPASVKALLRRGSAKLAQGLTAEARVDFERVLGLEPRNRQATEELARLNAAEGGSSGDGFGSGIIAGL